MIGHLDMELNGFSIDPLPYDVMGGGGGGSEH